MGDVPDMPDCILASFVLLWQSLVVRVPKVVVLADNSSRYQGLL